MERTRRRRLPPATGAFADEDARRREREFLAEQLERRGGHPRPGAAARRRGRRPARHRRGPGLHVSRSRGAAWPRCSTPSIAARTAGPWSTARRWARSTACVHLSLGPEAVPRRGHDAPPGGLRDDLDPRLAVHLAGRASGPRCWSSSARARCTSGPGWRRSATSSASTEAARRSSRRSAPRSSASIPPTSTACSRRRGWSPTPRAPRTWPPPQRMYREQVEEAFVLDTALPRSPWWLMPALGRRRWSRSRRRRGVLTYALSQHGGRRNRALRPPPPPADLPLPRRGAATPRTTRTTARSPTSCITTSRCASSPSGRSCPARTRCASACSSPSRPCGCAWTNRCAWSRSSSAEGREHLFFRVRHQDSVMVSLGPLAGQLGEITLTVRFSGVHRPEPVEREVLQVSDSPFDREPEGEIALEPRARLLEPDGLVSAGCGGRLRDRGPPVRRARRLHGGDGGDASPRPAPRADARSLEYRQDLPGKYITAAVGRLAEVAAPLAPKLRAFSVPRARSQTAPLVGEAAEMITFFEGIFGPCPYPDAERGGDGGEHPGRPQPTRHGRDGRCAPRCSGTSCATTPRPSGTCPASSSPTSWRTNGGGRASPDRTTTSAGSRRRWRSTRRRCGCGTAWATTMFRTVMERMARWALRHSDQGPIHLGHRLGHLQADPQIYRAVVYDKGAWVLHMLRAGGGRRRVRARADRVAAGPPLRQGGLRAPPPGVGEGVRPRAGAVLPGMGLRHRAARAPGVAAHHAGCGLLRHRGDHHRPRTCPGRCRWSWRWSTPEDGRECGWCFPRRAERSRSRRRPLPGGWRWTPKAPSSPAS